MATIKEIDNIKNANIVIDDDVINANITNNNDTIEATIIDDDDIINGTIVDGVTDATTTKKGIVRLATSSEGLDGQLNNNVAINPYVLKYVCDRITASIIDLNLDTETYELTIALKNENGDILSSETIDFPIENTIVDCYYDSENKQLVFVLKSGEEINVPVGDLIDGLQAEITVDNKLSSDLVDDTSSNNNKFVNSTQKTLLSNITITASEINSLNGITGNVQEQINGLDSIISGLDDSITALDSIVSSNYTTLSDSITAVDNKYDSIISGLSDSITGLDDKYDSITSSLSDSITALDSIISSNYTTLDNKIDSINGALGDDIDALESVVSANFSTLSDSITALDSTVSSNYTTLDNKIDSISGALTDSITAIDSIISGYGDIVSHDVDEFATSQQGNKADTAIQPNDNISELMNNVGYITGIDSTDVTSALGYTPVNPLSLATVATSGSYDDLSNKPTIPTVNNATLTIQKNSTNIDTFTANASVDKTINISVPVNASDVNALPDTTKYGSNIDVSLNTTDYKLTISLKDQDGTVLNSKVVDFPIESVVVNGSYDNVNQKIILTLQNGNTIDIPVGALISGLQTEITSSNKLDADLINDSTSTNKFVTANEKTTWNNKQDTISDLSTIRSNATNGQNAYTTIQNYGNIVTHNTSEFATSAQGILADSALQPNDNISDLNNDVGYITSSALTNYVTTNTDQNITGVKTFVGQKRIGFKQSGTSDKLGFTLYNNSGTEKGYLEYNPSNTIDGVPLMTLGNYATASGGLTHVGFRKYSSISGASGAYNLLAPLISDAKTPFNLTTTYTNFYLPLGFTDGNTTVLTAKSGLVNISTLFPDLSNYVTSSSLATTLTNYVLSSSLATVATSGDYDDLLNKPTIPTVPTNISAFTNDSGYITSSALSGYATETWVGNQGYITGITSSDVITALGYTPYSDANPSGYEANTIDTVKVNGTALTPDSDKAVNIVIPSGIIVDQVYDGTSANAQSGVAIEGAGFLTSSALSGYATETWVGQQGYALASSLSTVATSGSYNDLTNKPTIPTVNNSTITIQKNSTTVDTFTLNQSTAKTINISVPTKVSDLTNDSGFITGITSSDVTTALGYTPYNSTNPSGYQANVIETVKVNGTAQTVTSKAVDISVPTKVSQLTNDSGYTTNVGTVTKVNNTSPDSNGNVSLTIPTVNNATLYIQKNGSTVNAFTANASSNVTCNITVPTKTSDLQNDSSFITGIDNSMVIAALGYTPYNSTNPNGYQANVIETIKVNGNAQTVTSKTVDITVPSAVTESTVSGWGFTKNTGTVTSVNSTGPDSNGNVSITIPTVPTNVSAFTNDSKYIANTATGTNSLTISGTASSATSSLNIGATSTAGGGYSVAVGYYAASNGARTTSIGYGARIGGSTADAIQIGNGTNSTAKTLSIGFYNTGNYTLLDGTTGLIPSARIPIDGSTITVNASGQLQSTGGSSGANTDLSNLSATGKAVIDGQWTWKYLEVATNTSSGSYEHNLSSYLPNDTYSYEIFLRIGCYYNSANAGFAVGTVASPNTNKSSSGNYFVYQYVTTNTRGGYCNAIIPVGTSRKIYSQITAALQNSTIELFGYRRIGTNT